jgi:type II secretory pathway component PulC
MKSVMSILITTVLLLSGNPIAFSAEQQDAPQNAYENYKIIFERNIFSKDRLPPQKQSEGRRVRTTQVLAIYVLRGIAVQKEERVAFVEEQISAQTMKAGIGTELLNGRITEIKYDRVAFEQNGQTKYVKVGGEFGKTESTVVSTVSEEEQQEETPINTEEPAGGGTSGGSEESDILKKLMERRQSELGQ